MKASRIEVEAPEMNESWAREGVQQLLESCTQLADLHGVELSVVTTAIAQMVERQVEFMYIKQEFDVRHTGLWELPDGV